MTQIRLRSEIPIEGIAEDAPMFDDELASTVNPEYWSPENADRLIRIRDHLISQPEQILLDTYQLATELELKHPSGTLKAQTRYLVGLRGEIAELQQELETAREENPYLKIGPDHQVASDYWIYEMLDPDRMRHTDLSGERKLKAISEYGDVLWYAARMAAERGVTLSQAFIVFLRNSNEGEPLRERLEDWKRVLDQARRSLSFEWTQKMALDNKAAWYLTDATPEQKVTIDSHPDQILAAILDELRLPDGSDPTWDPAEAYPHLPQLEITIGKLVWFTAYTSSTLLNADFATVMRGNLEKLRSRGSRGTIASRHFRDERDEANLRASRSRRAPIS